MTAWEWTVWKAYYRFHGFDADRVETTVALAGEAVARPLGNRVDWADLVPKFGPRERQTFAEMLAVLAAIPGAKVEFIPDVGQ